MEQEVADIYTTDQVASVLMGAAKSNYSWDLEIQYVNGVVFIDKRQEDRDTNILNFQTVCETSLEHQPNADNSINGIKPLMVEAQRINDSWLHASHSQNVATQVQLDDENPFIEKPTQLATRVGYVYRVW